MKNKEKLMPKILTNQKGVAGYVFAWFLGIPVVVLVLFKLFFD